MSDLADPIVWQAKIPEAVLPSESGGFVATDYGIAHGFQCLRFPLGSLQGIGVSALAPAVGMEFTVLDAAPHKISGAFVNQKDAVPLLSLSKARQCSSQITRLSSWGQGYCIWALQD